MLKLTNLDNETSYHYALGSPTAKEVLDKGGCVLLIDFMWIGKTGYDDYNAIEKHLAVNKSELNDCLREQLENESKK